MLLYESIFTYTLKKYKKLVQGNTAFFLFSNHFISNPYNINPSKSTQHDSFKQYLKYKFFILKNFILYDKSNVILIENILNVFGKVQQLYLALLRFKHISLMKSKQYLTTQIDLNFNDLCNIPNKHKINIIHHHTKYQFYIIDLIRIINSSLSYEYELFPEPKSIKNPWNNEPFLSSDLYNIYFFIKNSNINMPLLFLRYFQCNFCLKQFENNNQLIIVNYNIENCHNLDDLCKYRYLCRMLSFYNNNPCTHIKHRINISYLFPKNRMIEIFGKYLKMYMFAVYSNEHDIRKQNQTMLFTRLRRI